MLELQLTQRSGVPFYRQIEDQTAEAIRAGRIASGTRLPSVRELAATLRVSAITVRRAYAELESQGLIERRQGRGTFVCEPPADVLTERHARAREVIESAVDTARGLGLSNNDVRAMVERRLVQQPRGEA